MTSPLNTRLGFLVDEGSKKKAISAFQDISKAQNSLVNSGNKTNSFYASLSKGNQALATSTDDLVDSMRKEVDFLQAVDEATKDLVESRKKLNAENTGFDKGKFGDIETSFSAIGGIASTAGLGGVGEGLGAVGELTALGEELPRLGEAFGEITKGIGSSGLGSAIQSVIPGLSGATIGAGLLGGALIAVTAIVGAVSLAVGEYNKQAEAQKKAIEAQAQAIRDINTLQREGLTTEDATAQRDALLQQLQDEMDQLAQQNRDYAATVAVDSNNIFGGIEQGIIKLFSGTEDGLANSITTTQSNIDSLNAQIAEFDATISSGELITNDAVVAEEELTQVRAETVQQLETQLTQAESQRTASLGRISALEEQRDTFLENSAQSLADKAEDQALADKFALEDGLARAQKHQDDLVAIQEEGRAKIKSINDEIASLPAQRLEELGKAQGKADKERSKVEKEYMASELERLQNFQKSEKRLIDKQNLDRLRAIQDLNEALNDAQRENNVIAFLQAQRDGEKNLQRNAQDLDTATQQRQADFSAETQARQQALQERLAEIRTNLADEQASIRASYDEKRAQLKASIDEETQAIKDRTAQAISSYEAELAAQAQRDARQAERDAITEARRQRAHDEQLARIDEQTQAEQRALREVTSTISQLTAELSRLQSGNSAQSPSRSVVSGINSRRPNRRAITAFAGGGIVNSPTLALLGEGAYPEAVIPFAPSEGIGNAVNRLGIGGSSRAMFAPQFNVQVGDIASRNEVTQALDQYSQVLMSNLASFLQTAQAGGNR